MMDSITNIEHRILVNQYMGLTDICFISHAAFIEKFPPYTFKDILSNVNINLLLDWL